MATVGGRLAQHNGDMGIMHVRRRYAGREQSPRDVDEDRGRRIAGEVAEAGADGLLLADTVGYGQPAAIGRVFRKVIAYVAPLPVAAHFHDTRGLGLANVLAQQFEKLLLHPRHARSQRGDAGEREAAQAHRVECHGVARIGVPRNRAQADDLAGQEKTLHLLAALAVVHIGFHRAGAHRGDGVEGISLAEQVRAFGKWPDVFDQHVQLGQPALVVALVEAGRRKRARAAEAQRFAVVADG